MDTITYIIVFFQILVIFKCLAIINLSQNRFNLPRKIGTISRKNDFCYKFLKLKIDTSIICFEVQFFLGALAYLNFNLLSRGYNNLNHYLKICSLNEERNSKILTLLKKRTKPKNYIFTELSVFLLYQSNS